MSTASAYRNALQALDPQAAKAMITRSGRRHHDTKILRQLRTGASLLGLAATSIVVAQSAAAQTAPPSDVVGACSGVSLPPSVITQLLTPVVTGIADPLQTTLNPIIGNVGSIGTALTSVNLAGIQLVANLQTTPTPPLRINLAGILADAVGNQPITLSVLNGNGTAVGPNDACVTQADGFTLRNQAGLSIGGNRITGLGTNGFEAFAADPNAIAFGNSARTGVGAVGAIAFGAGASANAANGVALGAGSVSARPATTGYTAIGLAAPQNSAGEVSVGAPGA
ncbi:MAG: hypothetical protein EOP89_11000, partial [Lysobacteraceae bacterium]